MCKVEEEEHLILRELSEYVDYSDVQNILAIFAH